MVFTTLEESVTNLYKDDLGIYNPKEINMVAIAECLDIKLDYWDESSEAYEIKGQHWIMLNEFLSPQEAWQDFAHELCHVLQHEGYQLNMRKSFRLYQEVKADRSEEHTSELQSRENLVCRLLLEKKKKKK